MKVALFTVDFKLTLERDGNKRELLLDVLGGSLFVNKNCMSRKTLWRHNILASENDVRFVNLTEWHQLSGAQKIEKIEGLISGK